MEGRDLVRFRPETGTISALLQLNNCHPTVDFIEYSGSFAFSNVVPIPGSADDIVQVGIGNCRSPTCSGGIHYYTGYGRNPTTPGCSGYSHRQPIATEMAFAYKGLYSHDLKVGHSPGNWYFYTDNTLLQLTADSNICWTGKQAVWFGESWDAGDAIGGPATDVADFGSTNYATTVGGGYTYTSFNPNLACNYGPAQAAYYKCDVIKSTEFLFWTAR